MPLLLSAFGGAGSAPAFTPPDLAGCVAWFKAGLISPVPADDDEVTSMPDHSGALVLPTLAKIGGGSGPHFVASGTNGRADLSWLSSPARVLVGNASVVGTTGITLFAILKTTTTASGRLFGMQYNAYHYLLAVNYSGGFGDGIVSYLTADGTEARSDAPVNDGQPHVVVGTWSDADDTGRVYVDGTVAAAVTAASSTHPAAGGGDANAAGSGSDGANDFQAYTGQMPEWGAYNRALSGADLAALVAYLKTEAGI